MDTGLEEPALQTVGNKRISNIKAEMGSVTTYIAYESTVFLNVVQFDFKERTGVFLEMKEILLLDDFPGLTVVEEFNHVYLLLE